MYKRLIQFIFICLLSAQGMAQELIVNWTKFICCGNVASSTAAGIATSDGGIVFTGKTSCNNSGDFSATPHTMLNLIVGKLDAAGQLSWLKTFGGSADDEGIAACEASNGGYMIIGKTNSGDGDISGFNGTADIWLLKLDVNGNKQWSKVYGSSFADVPIAINPTSDGGYIILGASNGSGGDVPAHYGSSQFLMDWLVLKVDANGNKQWAKSIGGSQDEGLQGSIIPVGDAYYLVGYSDSKDHECTDNNWNPGIATSYDYYILKLDNTGNVLWTKVYGGKNGDGSCVGMFDEGDSSIIVSGYSGSNDHYVSNNKGGSDFWVLKLDLDGKIKWNKTYGGKEDEQWCTIIKAPQQGYLLYGFTTQWVFGNVDSWLFALDNAGNIQKEKFVGGDLYEMSAHLVPYQNGFAALGFSESKNFAEGTSNGRQGPSHQIHISKIEFFPSGINDIGNGKLALHPNAAGNSFTIEFEEKNNGTLTVADSRGAIVYRQRINKRAGSVTVESATWASGVYYVRLEAGGKMYSAKLVKN